MFESSVPWERAPRGVHWNTLFYCLKMTQWNLKEGLSSDWPLWINCDSQTPCRVLLSLRFGLFLSLSLSHIQLFRSNALVNSCKHFKYCKTKAVWWISQKKSLKKGESCGHRRRVREKRIPVRVPQERGLWTDCLAMRYELVCFMYLSLDYR